MNRKRLANLVNRLFRNIRNIRYVRFLRYFTATFQALRLVLVMSR